MSSVVKTQFSFVYAWSERSEENVHVLLIKSDEKRH